MGGVDLASGLPAASVIIKLFVIDIVNKSEGDHDTDNKCLAFCQNSTQADMVASC